MWKWPGWGLGGGGESWFACVLGVSKLQHNGLHKLMTDRMTEMS